MILEEIATRAAAQSLAIMGHCPTHPDDDLGAGTLVLIGPTGPDFWATFSSAGEAKDGRPDPMDRWSRRVISEIAEAVRGEALFPFGTPLRPFISWALRSGQAWQSPVGLLVHAHAGLLVSYRGAILVTEVVPAATDRRPCEDCAEQPCLAACPAGALTVDGYDLGQCHAYLDGAAGASCLQEGCAVRISCPVSQRYGRAPAQNAFHMASFHPSAREG